MRNCPMCQGEVELAHINREYFVDALDAPCVIENIMVERCKGCGKILNETEADDYAQKQLLIFRRNGIHITVQSVLEDENMEWQELANRLGMTKQNLWGSLNRQELRYNAALLFRIAYVLQRKFKECFQYYPLFKGEDGKYYLDKQADLF